MKKITMLKNILPFLDKLADVELYDELSGETAFSGIVLDIPWIYLNHRLIKDENGEPISVIMNGEGCPTFHLSIAEK